jgi:hypothetical protein
MRPIPCAQDTTAWGGSYRIVRDDPFFARAVRVGQKYVDEKARGRLRSSDGFLEEMAALRATAPADGAVLLDEMEHRWSHPEAPPALYVLTMEVFVTGEAFLIAGDKKLGQRAQSTKVGEASRSLAPRLSVYAGRRGLRGAEITPGSLVLRAVVYGDGPSMLFERHILRYTKTIGVRLDVESDQRPRWGVTAESYWGTDVVEGILEFARAHLEQAEVEDA